MLGIIIIIITRNGSVTIDPEKGNTTVIIDNTAKGTAGLSASAGVAVDSPLGTSDPPPAAPKPGTERVTAAAGSGSPSSVVAAKSAIEATATRAGVESAGASKALPASAVKPGPVIKNSIGMKLALIAAGKFMIGSPNSDLLADDPTVKPQQPVQIERPFYLGIHEVTQAQYLAVMEENPTHVWYPGENLPVLIPRPFELQWKSGSSSATGSARGKGRALLPDWHRVEIGRRRVPAPDRG